MRLDLEWDRVVVGAELVILDEAQTWPVVFPRLRGAIDKDRSRVGRFLLLGSVSPSLMVHVSESLAGRLALVELTPLLLGELGETAFMDDLWMLGGYPDGGVLGGGHYPRWQRDYLTLLTQRDLPNWGLPARPQTTHRLLRMLAALHGQQWNASQVGQSLGLSYHTVDNYVDYLVGAFLVRRLEPYQANIAKRVVKRPKIYWRDSGLLHALLGVRDREHLLQQPWCGASWEGFVTEQAIGRLYALGSSADAFYFRTSDQYEVDLVLEFGTDLWAVEIKLTSAPDVNDMARLDKAADLIGASRRYLVSQTCEPIREGDRASLDLPSFLAELR